MVTGEVKRMAVRRAITLLELTVVVSIVGLLSVLAATRYGMSTLASEDGRGFAQKLSLDLLQARQRSVATGDNHLLRFTIADGEVKQYEILRRQGATLSQVDEVCIVPENVVLTTGGTTDAEFRFTAEALGSYTFFVQAAGQSWTVSVPQATGRPFLQ